MSLTLLEKATLGVSGVTAVGIGGFIMIAPQAFYASYGITLGDDPSLLSELRAPAAGLLTLGTLMLVGIWRSAMAQLAVAATLIVFLAFPMGRLVGLAVDGGPVGRHHRRAGAGNRHRRSVHLRLPPPGRAHSRNNLIPIGGAHLAARRCPNP